jgi:hypothetical protein
VAGPKFRPTSLSCWHRGMDVHRNGPVDPTANRHFADAARDCGRHAERDSRAAQEVWRFFSAFKIAS